MINHREVFVLRQNRSIFPISCYYSDMDIDTYVESCRDEQIDLLMALGRIPSPSRHEERRAEAVRSWLEKNGFEGVRLDRAKNVCCLIGDKEPLAAFSSHTDIVFPDTEPLPMRRDGDILYAPGIGDDTANLVNLLLAARYILSMKDKMERSLLIAAVSCEEGLGNLDGTKELFRAYGKRIQRYISLDGNIGSCVSLPVGSHRYEVTVRAKGGHSYKDFGADNAIVIASGLIKDLYAIEPPEGVTYNVGTIKGGTAVNSIAQEAEFLYEYRAADEEKLQEMRELFYRTVARQGKDIRVRLLGVRPGKGRIDEESLRSFTEGNVRIIKEVRKGEVKVTASSTDSNIPLSLGIPANTIGTIAGGNAHTREEWVDLGSMQDGLRLSLLLMSSQAFQGCASNETREC